MGTILTIAESFANGSFDMGSDMRTVDAFGFECVPFAVNDCTRLEVASAMNEIFAQGSNLPSAVKVGFITKAEVVLGVAERLKRYKVTNIVVDPAIIADDGSILVTEDVFVSLSNKLFPLAAILTPNPYEVELLAGMEVHSEEDLVKASTSLSLRYKCAVFVKAYNLFGVDLLVGGEQYCWMQRGDEDQSDTYSFSTAFACQLPNCESLEQAAISASQFVFGVVEEEPAQKKDIPFSLTPKTPEASRFDIKPMQQENEVLKTTTGLSTDGEKQQMAVQSKASAPARDHEVVVDVDNFAPEPVINESLNKSLQELRAKLDKLR
ncbi:MAG: bifunctional hydroxymethylpyrimidine kinase/phosphomethylpyrimidine kinase [Clostridiales bacterium]|nr:bifunctional hydroxymethylpyrimidine kinase/phosphomethylpyrimidine kinase [Clostridiales bacterium]